MPNGGPDCCGKCGFNKAVQELVYPLPDRREQFWAISHCTLRNLKITDPFWTYCYSFCYTNQLPELDENEFMPPVGWVYASGLYEGYVRIPWHGDSEPVVSVSCMCLICGRTTDTGIKVVHAGQEIGFCTNRHYIDWWKTEHDDPDISSEGLKIPEAFYEEQS